MRVESPLYADDPAAPRRSQFSKHAYQNSSEFELSIGTVTLAILARCTLFLVRLLPHNLLLLYSLHVNSAK
jgi:hypothetical protein